MQKASSIGLILVFLLLFSVSSSAVSSPGETNLDRLGIVNIYNVAKAQDFFSGSDDVGRISIVKAFNCAKRQGFEGKVKDCEDSADIESLLSLVEPHSDRINFESSNGQESQQDTSTGTIELEITEGFNDDSFKVSSTPSFTAKAVDNRGINDNQDSFYGSNSHVRIEVDPPYSEPFTATDGECDSQTLRECSSTASFRPTISGTYTVKATAETVDGATETVSKDFTAVSTGLPDGYGVRLVGNFEGWDSEWSVGEGSENQEELEFSSSMTQPYLDSGVESSEIDQVVLMDTGSDGFCGSANLTRTLELEPGESRAISVEYELDAEKFGNRIGVWWSDVEVASKEPRTSVDTEGALDADISHPDFAQSSVESELKVGMIPAQDENGCEAGAVNSLADTRFLIKDISIN